MAAAAGQSRRVPTKRTRVQQAETLPPPAKAGAKPLRVLVVDDHALVRRGLCHMIEESEAMVCTEAPSTQEALRRLNESRFDLAIIDLSLADGSGIDLIKQVKSQHGPLPMLVLSMHDETLYAERALRAGAMGYVMKAEAIDQLISAIHTVLQGSIYVSPVMSDRILGRMMGTRGEASATPLQVLSDRELEVFELLGRGMGTRQIADKVCVSVKTIESHRESIKGKLGFKSGTELMHAAMHWVMREGAD